MKDFATNEKARNRWTALKCYDRQQMLLMVLVKADRILPLMVSTWNDLPERVQDRLVERTKLVAW